MTSILLPLLPMAVGAGVATGASVGDGVPAWHLAECNRDMNNDADDSNVVQIGVRHWQPSTDGIGTLDTAGTKTQVSDRMIVWMFST